MANEKNRGKMTIQEKVNTRYNIVRCCCTQWLGIVRRETAVIVYTDKYFSNHNQIRLCLLFSD